MKNNDIKHLSSLPGDSATDHDGVDGARVLLVDSDPEFRERLSVSLAKQGFKSDGVSTEHEAVASVMKGSVHAVVTELQLSSGNGLDLAQIAWRVFPGLPVIVLTGSPSVDTAARAVRLPVQAYLLKPPQISEFLSLLSSAVSNYRKSSAARRNQHHLRRWSEALSPFVGQECSPPHPRLHHYDAQESCGPAYGTRSNDQGLAIA